MYISIGTRSQPKIAAVCSAFSQYPELCFRDGDLLQFMILPEKKRGTAADSAIDSVSKVSCNPLTLDELTTGAKNRAKEAYLLCKEQHGACDYGVGIEGGLFPVDGTETGYLDTSICAIYDGERYEAALPSPEKLCSGETYAVGVEGDRHYVISLTGPDGASHITPETERQVYRDSQRIAVWLLFGASIAGVVFCYMGIAVARHPERYSERVRRLFYKDGVLL